MELNAFLPFLLQVCLTKMDEQVVKELPQGGEDHKVDSGPGSTRCTTNALRSSTQFCKLDGIQVEEESSEFGVLKLSQLGDNPKTD